MHAYDALEQARYFNQGCDARLKGMSLYDCPYTPTEHPVAYRNWRLGWEDVHRNWGKWSLAPVRRLPEIRGRAG